jgi:hypothetical protein
VKIPSFIPHIFDVIRVDIPEYLYHYTSLSSFEKMLKTSDIFLFNSYQLNDYMENNVLLSVIDLVLSENKERFSKEFIDALNYTFTNKYRTSLPYVFCLSNKYNSLSQWRNYGDDCNGVCITFSTEKIGLKYSLPEQNVKSSYLYSIHNIIYSIEDQKQIVQDVLIDAMESATKLGNDKIKHDAFAEYAYMTLSRFMSIFKLQEFSEEDEWRIIYMPWLMGDADGNVITFDGRKDIGFLTSRNRIKSYFPFFRDKQKFKESIHEIQLGTKSEVSDFEIRSFLDFHGMKHVKFTRSTIPYR